VCFTVDDDVQGIQGGKKFLNDLLMKLEKCDSLNNSPGWSYINQAAY